MIHEPRLIRRLFGFSSSPANLRIVTGVTCRREPPQFCARLTGTINFAEENEYDWDQEDRRPHGPLVQVVEGEKPDGTPLARARPSNLQRLTSLVRPDAHFAPLC
jgi:hypothetical protein